MDIQIVLQTRSGLPSRASVAVVYEDGNLFVRLWIMDNGGVVTSVIMLLNIQSDYNANVSQPFPLNNQLARRQYSLLAINEMINRKKNS